MARSTYVYVLTQYGQVFGTYTVKHELISHVLRHLPKHLYSEYKVARYSDGVYAGDFVIIPLPEFLES